MATRPLSAEVMQEAVAAVRKHGTIAEAARKLGKPRTTIQSRYETAQVLGAAKAEEFTAEPPPARCRPLDEILEARRKEYRREEAYARAVRGVPVKIRKPGPIGILHFGDPHVDDPGCDIGLIERRIELVNRTDALYAGCIGDYTNNWVGKLVRLHAKQQTTKDEAAVLAEWFVKSVPWLYLVAGNHDAWNEGNFLLAKLAGENGDRLFVPNGVRLLLGFPNGREIRINARHVHKGQSQWNAAHGVGKAAQLRYHDHIVIGGHIHTTGDATIAKNDAPDPNEPEGRLISHCIQLASYKRWDDYADEQGFRDQFISPDCLTVIDPAATRATQVVTRFWDADEGADYLKWKRSK
jgi:hypothetical protein